MPTPYRSHAAVVAAVADEPLRSPSGVPSTDWMRAPHHRAISSHDLMAGERVIIIRHGKDEYRLRVTASDKLILTK